MNHKYRHSVIDVARTLAESSSGTIDAPLGIEELAEWLSWRVGLDVWKEGQPIMAYYDKCVRDLALAALDLYAKNKQNQRAKNMEE